MTEESDEIDMYETATMLQRRSELVLKLRRMLRDAALMNAHGTQSAALTEAHDAEGIMLGMQDLGYKVVVSFVPHDETRTGLTRVLLEPRSSDHD